MQDKEWVKQRAKWVALHNKGKSVREIANVYDVSTQRVYAVLKQEGIVFPKRGKK